jgi:unsaturated rhamnogalacturonyl hydrolase
MNTLIKLGFLSLAIFCSTLSDAQQKTWADSIDAYARESFMPPSKYKWTWQRAALLDAMIFQYNLAPESEKAIYLNYIRAAMDGVYGRANGKSPNAVASGVGMAFLARITGEEKYRKAADKVFADYLKVQRTENGGITHKSHFQELWDDTIYMVGVFLQQMFLLTGEEKYMDELLLQIRAHHEKLSDPATGLWYHGWDGDDKNRCNWCGQTGWSKNPEKRSNEFWGRGNGWVVVTLSNTLKVLPDNHRHKAEVGAYLLEMISKLPEVQDQATGHWFQLPMRPTQPGNYIESSCTAMFAYGIQTALQAGLVSDERFAASVKAAYEGLRAHSVRQVGEQYLTVQNVCKGTCIGDMEYYLNRKASSEKPFGLGMFIFFGRAFEGGASVQ